MRPIIPITALAVALAGVAFTPSVDAADTSELQALRAQVAALEQQIKIIARQIELQEEAAVAAAATTPKITVNDKGFTLASADGAHFVKIRGLVQLDGRQFFDDGGGLINNAFVLRRARLISEGQFAQNFAFQLVTEFAGSSTSILDANFVVSLSKELQFKFGKFKYPLGLELLQADAWTFFNERSLATNLVPNRDLGIQLQGELFGGRLSYQAGVFNGVGDGSSTTNTDFDEDKDLVARIIASPFKDEPSSQLQGLSFGVGASVGREKTAAARTSGYRTDGQQTFFSYLGTTVGDGKNWRVVPQFDYRRGSWGAMGEYVISTVNVRANPTAPISELKNKARQVTSGYVLTGEDSSYQGVVPRNDFNYSAGTWGAFEVVGRYASLRIDDEAFPVFAAPGSNAQEATAYGLGLNWYLSKSAMVKIDFYQTHFGFSGLAPATTSSAVIRQDEKAFITRFQLTF